MTSEAETLLLATREKLQEMLDSVEALGEGEGIHDSTVKQVCRLSQAISANAAQLRQYEKTRKRAVASIPLEQIVAHLKTLPQTKRDEVCRAVSGADDDKALL